MPEGPEVRRYTDMINRVFTGQKLMKVEIMGGRYETKSFVGYDEMSQMLPLTFESCIPKGKVFNLVFNKNKKRSHLLVHLNMSGLWFVDEHHATNENKTHIKFVFETYTLGFYDSRRFGVVEYTTNVDKVNEKLNDLGPDMMNDEMTFEVFQERLKNKKRSKIANLLLDQHTVSGVGNYLRADSLYYAKINPMRTVGSLKVDELKNLFHAIRVIMWINYDFNLGVSKGIITASDMERLKLMLGTEKYNEMTEATTDVEPFLIYGRETDYLGNKVTREELNARTIHYVISVQK
jgi:formamidopyrimidine-DNA glycosylase